MRSKFDEQLRLLNEELLRMGSMIEEQVQKATQAMYSQDVDAAKEIMKYDEQIDQEQKKIETICFQLLIQQQPVARDLRLITAAMKMVTDMERIGDKAADIAEMTLTLAEKPYAFDQSDLKKMTAETITMLIHAIEAYVEKSIEKAQNVIDQDDIVDDLFLKIKQQLIDIMKRCPEYEEQAADLLMVDKSLERIGDHATNIAEWVIFSLDNHQEED